MTMKNIQFKRIVAFLFTAAMFMAVSSCTKEDSLPGLPEFSKISPLKELGTAITEGDMGDWVAIQGVNLETTTSIIFNDVPVDMQGVYYENDVLYLQIPVLMPAEITNKVKIVTTSGEIEFNFNVKIPNLKLTGMFNEYVQAGDTLKIYGDFFKLYEIDNTNTVVSFNGIEQPLIHVGSNFLTVKVPANVEQNIKLTVINNKYNASAVCPGYFQDRQFLITNFDDVPYTGGDGAQFVGNWTNPKPISGKFSYLTVGTGGSGWMYLMGTGVSYTNDMKDHPDKYEVKFEMNMITPIVRTKFYIYNYWNHPPAEITAADLVVQNVGVWQTLKIPLERIIPLNFTGNKDYIGSFNVRVESPAGESVALCWDNFRITLKD